MFGQVTETPAEERLPVDLTKRQQEIFDFIKSYSGKHGYPPTVRDIGKAVGLASSSTVHAHLANLEKAGLLRRDPSKPRAIELLDRAVGGVRGAVTDTVQSLVGGGGLPVVGSVAAGAPVLGRGEHRGLRDGARRGGRRDGQFILKVRATR
jgi:repressor LexA